MCSSDLDLGNGKYLFALIKDAELQALRVFGERPLPQFTNALIASAKMTEDKMGAGPVSVPVEFMPLLVTFDDITKPETVKRVDPNNLTATFGAGYALKSITLEITDEPVTEGKVESVLGWLESVGRERASLKPYPKGVKSNELKDAAIQLLEPSAFSSELYK